MEFMFNSLFFFNYLRSKKSDALRITVNTLSVLCVCKIIFLIIIFEKPFVKLKRKIGDLYIDFR